MPSAKPQGRRQDRGLEVLPARQRAPPPALAYGLHENTPAKLPSTISRRVLSTFPVLKLISTTDGDIFHVLSTNGDTHLGGDDIDNLLQALVHE